MSAEAAADRHGRWRSASRRNSCPVYEPTGERRRRGAVEALRPGSISPDNGGVGGQSHADARR
jgi:hypothetical protein